MKEKFKSTKKMSLFVTATLLASISATADTSYQRNVPQQNGGTKVQVGKQNIAAEQSTLNSADELTMSFTQIKSLRLSRLKGGAVDQPTIMPNVEKMMSRIRPMCLKANTILIKAQQAGKRSLIESNINNPTSFLAPGEILANGLVDANNELDFGQGGGISQLHFKIAVDQSVQVSKDLQAAQKKEAGRGSPIPVASGVDYTFHTKMYNLIKHANEELDGKYLVPYRSRCGYGGPIVVYPQPEIPLVQSQSQQQSVSAQGVPLPQRRQYVPPQYGGYPPPFQCGHPFIYVTQVKQLASMFLGLAGSEQGWTGFGNSTVQLSVLKSLVSAAKTVLLFSDFYDTYYAGLINHLEWVETEIGTELENLPPGAAIRPEIYSDLLSSYLDVKKDLEEPLTFIQYQQHQFPMYR